MSTVGATVHFREAAPKPAKGKQQVHLSTAVVTEVHDEAKGDVTLAVNSPYSAEPVTVRATRGDKAGCWDWPR